jgi:hypothetical protein
MCLSVSDRNARKVLPPNISPFIPFAAAAANFASLKVAETKHCMDFNELEGRKI